MVMWCIAERALWAALLLGAEATPLLPSGNTSGLQASIGTQEQPDALIPVGGEVTFYTVGSSNAAWQTWPDHLHAELLRLGYQVVAAPLDVPGATSRPSVAPVCADQSSYADLQTHRLGMIGWASWGFAYDDASDCDAAGFRHIAGFPVSCTNAWACNPQWTGSVPLVPKTALARAVRGAQFVILANWVNDGKEALTAKCRDACYKGADIDFLRTAAITEETLKATIRAIHAESPSVVVLVLARYPDMTDTIFVNEHTLAKVTAINAAIRQRLQDEPNTHFVDFSFPLKEDMYQTLSKVHPNCRGDKVITTSILEALYTKGVIARGLVLGETSACLGSKECAQLDVPCCQRSALCRWDAAAGCVPYGPGEQ